MTIIARASSPPRITTSSHEDEARERVATNSEQASSGPSQTVVAGDERQQVYIAAAHKMRRGKRLVMCGFVVAVLGIVGYCVACLTAAASPGLGSAMLSNPAWLAGPTLGVIGLGTLLWLIGSFTYLSAAMNSDPDGPDPYY